MARFKDAKWNLPTHFDGSVITWDEVHAALLMDLRDELKQLNNLLSCSNFISIPRFLREVAENTKKCARTKKPPARKRAA